LNFITHFELKSSKPFNSLHDTYNSTKSGKKNLLGEGELVDAITSGRVELDVIDKAKMPASLQAMAPAEQMAVITE